MDLTESESSTEREMELEHFSHPHPLIFIQHHIVASEDQEEDAAYCSGCGKPVEDSSYGCNPCKFYLHKGCAELELVHGINHPFHPQHYLPFWPKARNEGYYMCNLCGELFWGFAYHCGLCHFSLHINCASLQPSTATNFPNPLHQHPLFFIENHNNEVKYDCSGCKKSLSGPIYHCSDCSSLEHPHDSNFNLHKECAELQLELNHPYDRMHPLTLLPERPTHPEECRCNLCKIQWTGFVYSCSLCNLYLSLDDFLSLPRVTGASHEHSWTLISRRMSFVCDFCGTAGDHTPCLCTICNLLVHKNCISLPRKILITRHSRVISLSYSLRQNQVEDWTCKICYMEVDPRYGSYYCSAPKYHYIAHVNCATSDEIWDGTIIPDDYDESSMEALDSSNLITDVVKQISIEGQMVASEIRHAFHGHNLTLTFSGEIEDDSQCDGCMGPISIPFYRCGQCKFFLHKGCAELPREIRHPFHKHFLTLTNSQENFLTCFACKCLYHGFSYQCYKNGCREYFGFEVTYDIQCIMSLSETLKHPSHDHSLYLVHNFKGDCSGCFCDIGYATGGKDNHAYRCMKRCDFVLDIDCAKLPLAAWYKYDKHSLALTCSDDSDPSQLYCDLCENERRSNDWFYYCADCDNSLHSDCALGDLPYMKLGNKVKTYPHPHPLTVVKNTWNCPPCEVCRELCNGQALECKEPDCNFTVHWRCQREL